MTEPLSMEQFVEVVIRTDSSDLNRRASARKSVLEHDTALRAALAAQTAECEALTEQRDFARRELQRTLELLTEAREARQREEARHEAKMIAVINERDAARAELEAAWSSIVHSWSMETREQLTEEAKTNGFRYGLCQAIHHTWKRDPRVEAALTEARGQVIAEIREWAVYQNIGVFYYETRAVHYVETSDLLAKLATLDTRREGEE